MLQVVGRLEPLRTESGPPRRPVSWACLHGNPPPPDPLLLTQLVSTQLIWRMNPLKLVAQGPGPPVAPVVAMTCDNYGLSGYWLVVVMASSCLLWYARCVGARTWVCSSLGTGP